MHPRSSDWRYGASQLYHTLGCSSLVRSFLPLLDPKNSRNCCTSPAPSSAAACLAALEANRLVPPFFFTPRLLSVLLAAAASAANASETLSPTGGSALPSASSLSSSCCQLPASTSNLHMLGNSPPLEGSHTSVDTRTSHSTVMPSLSADKANSSPLSASVADTNMAPKLRSCTAFPLTSVALKSPGIAASDAASEGSMTEAATMALPSKAVPSFLANAPGGMENRVPVLSSSSVQPAHAGIVTEAPQRIREIEGT
mmetsp:Transcript_18888/g.38466  ORF Transcript_18888/g.38466 Transcript_18888/m.38466 type:complete len:256 (+) Transcript_18888:377-1144(+)